MDTPEVKAPEFVTVSKLRFWLFSMLTFGIYEVYWYYRHWKIVKQASGANIWPIPRAIFLIFFCYELFQIVLNQAKKAGVAELYNPSTLAWVYISSTIVLNAWNQIERFIPDMIDYPIWLFAIVLPPYLLWPVQDTINKVNAKNGSEQPEHRPFRTREYFVLGFGVLMFILSTVGFLTPVDESPERKVTPAIQQEPRPQRPL